MSQPKAKDATKKRKAEPKASTTKSRLIPRHYRKVWNTEGEAKVKLSAYYPGKYSEAEWDNAWFKLKYALSHSPSEYCPG